MGVQAVVCQPLLFANQDTQFPLPTVARKGFGLWFWLINPVGTSTEGILGRSFFSLKKRLEMKPFFSTSG